MPDLGIDVLFKGTNMLRLLGGLWVAARISLISIVISMPDVYKRQNVTFKMTGISAADRACDGTCKEEPDGTENAGQGTEVEQLSALFRNILGMEDCNSSLLEVHLRSFLAQIDADEMLSVLKPFLVWQLMIRRQEALAEKQELSVTLGELLAYERCV